MDSDKFDNSYKGRYLAQQLGYTMSNIERFSKLGEVDGDPPDLRRGVVEDLAEIYGSDSDSITDIESEQSQIGKRIFKAIAPSLEGLGGERTKSSQKLMTMSAKNGEKVMEHLKKALESKSLTQEDIDSYLGTIASQEYVALASRNMMKLATGEGNQLLKLVLLTKKDIIKTDKLINLLETIHFLGLLLMKYREFTEEKGGKTLKK